MTAAYTPKLPCRSMATCGRWRLRRGALVLTLALLASVSACANTGRTTDDIVSTNSASTSDRTLTLGIERDPPSWDPPQLFDGGPALLAWQPVFDTLLRYEPDGTITPNAAEKFSFNDDNTVLTLTLRKNMTFTDGTPVDAKAAQASFEHYRDTPGPFTARVAGAKIAVLDDRTVTITTPAPNPMMPNFLTLSPGALASPQSLTSPDLATKPVGSGPYTFDAGESASGTNLVFKRNKDYWNAEAYPYDQIVMRVMADETARLNALQSGQINGAAITAPNVNRIKGAGLTLVENQPVVAGLMIADRDGNLVPGLGDARVRQAINMVFDREAIAKAIWQGYGRSGNQIFNPDTDAYSNDLKNRYPFDVNAARQLMSEAGYADGFDVTLPEVPGFTDRYTSLVVQQLGALNIRAQVVSVPRAEWVQRYVSATYPLFVFELPAGTPPQVVNAYLEPTSVWNVFHYVDPELTPLLAQARAGTGENVYQVINSQVTEKAWFAVFGYPSNFWALDPKTTAASILGSSVPYLYTFG